MPETKGSEQWQGTFWGVYAALGLPGDGPEALFAQRHQAEQWLRRQERRGELCAEHHFIAETAVSGHYDNGPPGKDDEPADVVPLTARNVHTALLLMDEEVAAIPVEVIEGWTEAQRRQAFEWAAREHLHASDNPGVQRLPQPAHVREAAARAREGKAP